MFLWLLIAANVLSQDEPATNPFVLGPCNVTNGDAKCCVSQCTCSVDKNQNTIRAQCSGSEMRIVPYINSGLPSTLQVLDLSDNKFEQLERNTFKTFNELRELNLSINSLNNFEPATFDGLTRLQVLDLSSNKFTEVPNKALRIISGLTSLIIGGNPIISLSSMEFAPLSNLTVLNINGLDKLTGLTQDTFSGLQSLQELRFSSSKLKTIPVLGKKPRLLKLDLSNNEIVEVRYSNLRYLRLLTTLWLNGNKINSISSNSFDDLECLEYLNLNNNKLVSLPQKLFKDPINAIGLAGNNWMCDCNIYWLASWVSERKSQNICIDGKCPKCSGGPPKWYSENIEKIAKMYTAMWCTVKKFTTDASTTPRSSNVGKEVEFKCGNSGEDTKWFDPEGKDVRTMLKTRQVQARFQFTGKGKLKITNISLKDVGTWTCYDPNTNYTAITQLTVTEPLNGVQTTTLGSTIVSTGRITRKPIANSPNTNGPKQTVPDNPTTQNMPPDTAGQPDLTKTKVIIGCFVGITLFCAILLIVFYKVRRKQNPNADWETKKVEPDDPMLTPRRHVTHSTISGSRRVLDPDDSSKVPTRMTNGSVAGTVNAPTPVSHMGTEIGHAGSEEQLRKGSNSQWPTQSEHFKRPFYSQPGTLARNGTVKEIVQHLECNPPRCVTNPNSPVKCQNAAIATLGHTYRTRTLSQSERTHINNPNASCHQIPQSLEKLPLQETAI